MWPRQSRPELYAGKPSMRDMAQQITWYLTAADGSASFKRYQKSSGSLLSAGLRPETEFLSCTLTKR